MHIVFLIREFLKATKANKRGGLDADKRGRAWNELCLHPDFGMFDFEETDDLDLFQEKLLRGYKKTKKTTTPRPENMDMMLGRMSDASWKAMVVECRSGTGVIAPMVKAKVYAEIYPSKDEQGLDAGYLEYFPETGRELLLRWVVTKNIEYNYLFLTN